MLNGKTAIVTGASRGIGRAIAVRFAAEGAKVAVIYSHSAESANDVVNGITAAGGSAKAYQCRVEVSSEVEATVNAVAADFGGVDILVNNAGITRDCLLAMMKEADFDDVIDVNLKGAYNFMRRVCPLMMRKRSGKIINISSVAALRGNPGQVNYSASKAGLIGMTRSAARELAPRHINVNAIAPGFILTDMTEKFASDEKTTAGIPLGRMGKPEEVAALAAFLASGESDYITGEVIRIDGGIAI